LAVKNIIHNIICSQHLNIGLCFGRLRTELLRNLFTFHDSRTTLVCYSVKSNVTESDV